METPGVVHSYSGIVNVGFDESTRWRRCDENGDNDPVEGGVVENRLWYAFTDARTTYWSSTKLSPSYLNKKYDSVILENESAFEELVNQ
jgi:hypothetical protein